MYLKLWRFRLYISIRPTMTKRATGYGITLNGHGKRAQRRAAYWDAFFTQLGTNVFGDD